MGAGDSKDYQHEWKLFSPEERQLLEQNFKDLSGSSKEKKTERKNVEVS